MTEALFGFAGFLLLAFIRVPLAFAMGIVGFVGFAYKVNLSAAASMVTQVTYETGMSYTLSVIPLFILMGNFTARAGMAEELFRAAYAFIGHYRGGLAQATVVACAGFGGPCGSSIATAATMAKVCYPPMKRLGYSDALSAGSIAAGGTLGILIPPSTLMVIYGIMTEVNIGKLFAAGILPGIVCTVLLGIAVQYVIWRDPSAGPRGERASWHERWVALKGVGGITALFVFVLAGIFGGLFTATEAGGVGAGGAFLFALWRRKLSWRDLVDTLIESASTTAMLFMILIGAFLFANFINYTTMPADLKSFVTESNLSPVMVVIVICAIYVILGSAMEELSMILLTVPLFFPVVTALGWDPVWFGIIIVLVVQIGLISPPVGMNIFVLRSLLPQVGLGTLFRGVMPFTVALIAMLGIMVAFPQLATWLPSLMK